jgi:hypothetical protein
MNARLGAATLVLALQLGGALQAAYGEEAMPYVPYSEVLLGNKLELEYPQTWRVEKERGKIDTYEQIRLMGPRNEADTFSALISVRVYPIKSESSRFAGVDAFIAHYTQHLPKDAQIEQAEQSTLAGVPAQVRIVSFIIPALHRMGLKGLPIPVKTKILVLQRGLSLLEVTCSSDAGEYAKQQSIFEHVLSSLRLE